MFRMVEVALEPSNYPCEGQLLTALGASHRIFHLRVWALSPPCRLSCSFRGIHSRVVRPPSACAGHFMASVGSACVSLSGPSPTPDSRKATEVICWPILAYPVVRTEEASLFCGIGLGPPLCCGHRRTEASSTPAASRETTAVPVETATGCTSERRTEPDTGFLRAHTVLSCLFSALARSRPGPGLAQPQKDEVLP
jgi:hypothetical protein